ncbi:MAG: aminoacetone oxidase family FAD-binding enzyme, partial [Candidatus Omnitrophica bacterium]|nr:aminoacetone oxidase family FAD-binding enzyme [Candidatus Omnitrophota bacterium]
QDELIDHYSKTGNFLIDAFKEFSSEDLIFFFSNRGLKFKIEDKGRIFPVSDSSFNVLDVMEKEINKLGVKILLGSKCENINISGDGKIQSVNLSDGRVVNASSVVLACGGVSYKATGSTGDGIRIAEKLGHKIEPLKPGLVSLVLKSDVPKILEGLSLNNVKLIYRSGKNKFLSIMDNLIFTHKGISGPVVLSSSQKCIDWMEDGREVTVALDCLPLLSVEELDKNLDEKFKKMSNNGIKNILSELLPERFSKVITELAGFLPGDKANKVTANTRKKIVSLLKEFKFDVLKSGSFEKAQVTRGGVSVKDIDPRTMMSKKIKNLFFAGEMIDIDGDCGGFNLQAAFSTGYLAGKCAE